MTQKAASIEREEDVNEVSFVLKRIKLILKVFIVVLTLGTLNGLFLFETAVLNTTFLFAIIVTFLLHLFVTRDTVNMVAGILIWLFTSMIFYLAWRYSGLFSTAMVALPVIVIIAVSFTRRIIYIPLLIFIILALLFISYAYNVGLMSIPKINATYPFIGKAIDIIIIVTAVFFIMELLMRGVRKKIQELETDNDALKVKITQAHKITDFDTLTQLPNERICKQFIEYYLKSPKLEGELLALFSLNIHNLKNINISIGHEAVDEILIQFSQRLTTLESSRVKFYRIQGHEFIALKCAPDHHDLSGFAEQVIQATKSPFNSSGYELEVSLSIGIAVAPFDGKTLEELRKKCHLALQYKKDNHEQAFHYFDTYMVNENENRVLLLADLKNAIENDEFELHFQPKIDLTSSQVVGAEALIRWNRKGVGMVPPDIFIPLAEESGLISKISQWVAINAIQACKGWHDNGLHHISVAINLSEVDFRRGNLPQKLISYLNDIQLAPHYLELELTESMIIDDVPHVQKQIQQLQDRKSTRLNSSH